MEEGCLSLPGVGVEVERPVHVRVRASDERGAPLTIEASGLEARVIQHEIDHLDGVLILDRTTPRPAQAGDAGDARGEGRAPRRRITPRPSALLDDGLGGPELLCARVYLGTSEFAAAVLERLAGSRTGRRSSSRGRTGRRAAGGRSSRRRWPIRARELGLDVIQPERLHDPEALERIAAAAPEAACVCAYGVLIKEPLLSAYEMLNVHPSLLPRWRGAAPIERAIMAGDAQTGVSIMRLTEGLDSGPVCLQEAEPIHPDDDYGTLAARLERLGGDLLVRALDERPPFAEQDESQVTYAHKIEAADRALDPARTPAELERTVRALRPHIGARVALPGGDFLGVIAARAAEGGPEPGVAAGRRAAGCCSAPAAGRSS